MLSSFAIAISLFVIPACVSGQISGQTQVNTTCYRGRDSKGVEAHHCLRALENIVYDADGRLDSVSSTVFVWHKTCVINIKKNKLLTPTKQMIEANVRNLMKMCPSKGGVSTCPLQVKTTVYRSTPYNVYEINKPMCHKKRCKLTPNDCLTAFNQFPVDIRGNFLMSPDRPYSVNTSGNCTVMMTTTDHSSFRASHPDINAAFKLLVNRCGSHPGSIYVNGGTNSYNGDIKLITNNLRNDTCV